ncbi:MAG: hypothetical protein LBJ36_00170 [Synergistaceae bacterium]|jgi:hypothetical protein|nr:hypothetical protein [Synergistaceae bacterium]
MTTATAEVERPNATSERQNLHQAIENLSASALERLMHYIEFLRYEDRMEELEDEEDLAYIEAHKDEPTGPLSEVIKDYEAQYGSFTRV